MDVMAETTTPNNAISPTEVSIGSGSKLIVIGTVHNERAASKKEEW